MILGLMFNSCQIVYSQTKKKTAPVISATVPPRSPDAAAVKDSTPEQKRRLESFLIVWQTIKDNYFDQTFNGLDWNKIKTEFEPRVLIAQSDARLHYVLQEMINRLNRSHFAIVPPEVAGEIEKARAKAKAAKKDSIGKADEETDGTDEENADIENDSDSKFGIGIEVRLLNNQVVITRIEQNSAAERAGLKTGFIIEKINDVSLTEFIEKIKLYGAYAKGVQKQLPLEIIAWFVNGEKNTSVNLAYLDEKDQSKQINIPREKLDGQLLQLLPSLPKQFFHFETKSLGDTVGYIKFNLFVVPAVDKFCSAISQFKDKKAVVIDLRGNIGGSYGVLMGISGLLTDKNFILGTEIFKIGRNVRLIRPHLKNYKGRIIVLTDNLSYSAAEIFAAALQENKRAIVVGEKSAGEALPAVTRILPTGAIFLYPIANFETPNGNLLEGKGIEPNVRIGLDRKSLLEGIDRQLQAALDYLKEDLPKPVAEEKTSVTTFSGKISAPPPPPAPKPLPKIIGKVDIQTFTKKPKIQDAKALKIFDNFVAAIGGEKALRNVTSYTAKGTAQIKQTGAVIDGEFEIYRKAPNKMLEVLKFDAFGEIREFFDGDKYIMQSKIFGSEEFKEPTIIAEKKLFADFYEILKIREFYPRVSYLGAFDREGKKVHLIEAETAGQNKVIYVFDVATGLLVHRTDTHADISFGDYRKTGDIFFPFLQTRSDAIIFQLTEFKANERLDENLFKMRENCFDKID